MQDLPQPRTEGTAGAPRQREQVRGLVASDQDQRRLDARCDDGLVERLRYKQDSSPRLYLEP